MIEVVRQWNGPFVSFGYKDLYYRAMCQNLDAVEEQGFTGLMFCTDV